MYDKETQLEQHQAEHVSSPEDTAPSDETQTVESRDQSGRGNMYNTNHDSISHTRTNETSTGTLETVPPKYQQFSVLATRLNSYRHWPKHLKQRPEDLAKAGLFYEGKNDYVRCFHCAGGMREWDPEDEPFYEHARWFPFCPFMKLIKGDKYIMGVQSGTIQPPDVQRDESRQEIDMFEHPAVLSVMELGFSKDILTKVITVYRKRHGTDLCAEKLLHIVWEIEENYDMDVIPEDDIIETKQANHNQEERECERTCEDTELTKKDEITKTKGIDELTEENRELREQKICKVCLDEEASIVFLPCGHLVTCPMCASALRKCPVCRTYIRGTVKAIIS
ncbi:putative inhibitor of apoptosis isoform X1 [Mizuhopecten yessoensis]|uniref:Baculoviral IAP repeat-containing protein 7-A n=2 Tax=Mizuhopecten yessoensis TaxID=6573 RepID=A0A210QS16_MIZYE|nr:putative inhibitor of apoptosis isoform X1 [Mizuhopecten yessoensis]XP_021351195.1 putative inhibitor of apoptosis isoform X1 [Mizuhopecten yessoensis]XP_021351196.1 putative inhibitor of apoptosis isoform X1 [Mizuhopecten yessoensis]XP_021351197.1 putative inhibitor of apoptosis isoform X1 [Mizuhopecten yessoensis]XP_021351199.1 putative inhibitor of apoptosis isoform X1 [Mizuhopecten yessoensis]OWF51547.1 Baculoviral IAP repeat-containing protein 7-A [Mizuhopecten yessoensis]